MRKTLSTAWVFGRAVRRSKPWSAEEVRGIFARARAATEKVRALSSENVINILAETGRLFANPKSKWRREALRLLRADSSFSEGTIKDTLDILPQLLDAGELRRRMDLELFLPYITDACVMRPGYNGFITSCPKGVALHVGAGNVFLGIIDSLLLGLLTRNVNVVKTATGASSFAVLFCRALAAADRSGALASSVSVLEWKGGTVEVERAAAEGSDVIFVWGGEDAVSAYKKLAPSSTHVTGFGPKMSMALVTAEYAGAEGMAAVAARVARDVCLWDQSACASPHTLYFIEPDSRKAAALIDAFMELAPFAFEAMQQTLPQGALSSDEQVEITRARELAKVDAGLGLAKVESSFPRTHWTIIAEKDKAFRVSPLHRVLYVKTASSVQEVARLIEPMRGYVQTVGVGGFTQDRRSIARALAHARVARITELGKMLSSENGSPHDGTFPMRELVNIVGVEGGWAVTDKLDDLYRHARANSKFYARHLKKGPAAIRTFGDYAKLPFLDKNHILENTPPESRDLFTGPMQKGVYFASGGSTGSPKYIFFNSAEYNRVSATLSKCFSNAGLGRDDRAANLFVAGNLWSSFITVEKALSLTDAVSVPVGSALPMETILKFLSDFQVTAIIGLPTFLTKLAEAVEASRPRVKIPLRLIFYGGEYVGPELTAYFGKVFPGVSVRSAGYATVDAGAIGYQCPHCKGSVHHLFEEEQFLEIVDTETGRPVPSGEVGELVTTVLSKRHMPILRFRLGDLGRFIEKSCPCGRKDMLFEILGRCDDRIHIGGAHVFVNDLQRAISAVPGLSLNFQAELFRKGHRDAMKLRVETRSPVPVAEAKRLSDALGRMVHDRCEDLAYVIDNDWMGPPEIEILPPDGIERISRTGKIKRVKDLRIKL